MKIGKGILETAAPRDLVFEREQIKYPKPKTLLIDVDESAADILIKAGFNVSVGTFGTPYTVGKADGYQPVIGSAELPNYTEQEIIVLDLRTKDLARGPVGEKHRPNGELDIWAKCDRGYIDPRPRSASKVRDSFNRTLDSGGVFVVFADARTGISLILARQSRYGELYDENEFSRDVWNFIGELDDLTIRNDHGQEMRSTDDGPLARLLKEHLEGGHFLCTLEGGYRKDDPWVTLAKNKFNQPVGICRCREKKGSVIILPQISEKDRFLEKLFTTVLPDLTPHLFPYIEQGKWVHGKEYELPRVLEIKAEQAAIEQRANGEIAALNAELATERTTNGWRHDLLTGTDAPLVEAVKKALTVLGFTKVVDVDEERDREGKSRREDLQIQDTSPTLVVDVKGISNFPTDADALQADKHAAIRMREQGRTDIVGLSIINHQRHLPPLDRVNTMPFRQELLDAAEQSTLGLLTSWDLFRLVDNFERLAWRPDDVKPLFYRKGRIEVVPEHYHFIGTIEKVWTAAFGVVICNGELRTGDRIAVEFPIEFFEASVDSIQVNEQAVEAATVGDPAGLRWSAGYPKIREGMRVFRVLQV